MRRASSVAKSRIILRRFRNWCAVSDPRWIIRRNMEEESLSMFEPWKSSPEGQQRYRVRWGHGISEKLPDFMNFFVSPSWMETPEQRGSLGKAGAKRTPSGSHRRGCSATHSGLRFDLVNSARHISHQPLKFFGEFAQASHRSLRDSSRDPQLMFNCDSKF